MVNHSRFIDSHRETNWLQGRIQVTSRGAIFGGGRANLQTYNFASISQKSHKFEKNFVHGRPPRSLQSRHVSPILYKFVICRWTEFQTKPVQKQRATTEMHAQICCCHSSLQSPTIANDVSLCEWALHDWRVHRIVYTLLQICCYTLLQPSSHIML